MSMLPKVIYRFGVIPLKTPMVFVKQPKFIENQKYPWRANYFEQNTEHDIFELQEVLKAELIKES